MLTLSRIFKEATAKLGRSGYADSPEPSSRPGSASSRNMFSTTTNAAEERPTRKLKKDNRVRIPLRGFFTFKVGLTKRPPDLLQFTSSITSSPARDHAHDQDPTVHHPATATPSPKYRKMARLENSQTRNHHIEYLHVPYPQQPQPPTPRSRPAHLKLKRNRSPQSQSPPLHDQKTLQTTPIDHDQMLHPSQQVTAEKSTYLVSQSLVPDGPRLALQNLDRGPGHELEHPECR